MHGAVHGQSPHCIKDVLVPLSDLPGHSRLRSAAAGQYDVPFTRTQFGRRALSVAASLNGIIYQLILDQWRISQPRQISQSRKQSRHTFLDKHIAKLLDPLLKVFALVLCS